MSKKHEYLLQQWSILIQDCMNSGKTIRAWCDEKGLTPRKYYYWLRRVREEYFDDAIKELHEHSTSISVTAVPSPRSKQKDETCTFVELVRPQAEIDTSEKTDKISAFYKDSLSPAAVIRINGIEAEIYQDASQMFISRLLSVMKDA